MMIRHERPMADLSFQVRAPLGLELQNGQKVTITSWSLKEIEFPGDIDILPAKGTLSIPFQGVDIRFDVSFEPAEGERKLAFVDLTGRQRETLAVFYRSILSGRMASTDEVITSLDTPVDLVPMGETDEEKSVAVEKVPSRWLRAIWNIVLYTSVAVAVVTIVGGQIWSNVSTVDIAQARVQAPLAPHVATENAYVETIFVEPGQTVAQGDVLVELSSPENATRLEIVRDDIRLAEAKVRVAESKLQKTEEEIETLSAGLEAAYIQAEQARREADFFADYDLDVLRQAHQELSDFDARRSPARVELDAIAEVHADTLRTRKVELGHLKRKLSAEKRSGKSANIVAKVSGVVREIPVFEDQYVTRGSIAAIVEEDAPRLIVGQLSETKATSAYPGMPASVVVNVNGKKKTLSGRVTEVSALNASGGSGTFGVTVSVQVDASSLGGNRDQLMPDAPVELVLEKEFWFLGEG